MKSIEILEKYYQNLNSNKDSIVPKDSKDGKEESKKKQFKLTVVQIFLKNGNQIKFFLTILMLQILQYYNIMINGGYLLELKMK